MGGADAEREYLETQVDGAQVLVGVFNERQSAERALHALQEAGISAELRPLAPAAGVLEAPQAQTSGTTPLCC